MKKIYVFLLFGFSSTFLVSSEFFIEGFNNSFEMPIDWIDQMNQEGILKNSIDVTHPLFSKEKNCSLFTLYPNLQAIPYISFASLPTPIEKLEYLSTEINVPELYIKRDDLTGVKKNSKPLFGGNKVRKLEFLLAEARAHGAKDIITFGCAGSNHAVATSLYSHLLGLNCFCLLKAQANSRALQHNLLMHQIYSSKLKYYPDNIFRQVGAINIWLDRKMKTGEFPYIIPTGGSNPLGTVGFVNAACELKQQIDEGKIPEPDFLYLPCGSLGTTVGLLLGCKMLGLKTKIIAVAVMPGISLDKIEKLFHETNTFLQTYDSSFPTCSFSGEDIIIRSEFYGEGYGVFTQEGMHARQLILDYEKLKLEGTYTAKAFSCLLDDAQKMRLQGKVVLFWDTYCGFDYSELVTKEQRNKSPWWFSEFFDKPVQELDR